MFIMSKRMWNTKYDASFWDFSIQIFSYQMTEYVKIIVRENEINVGWSQAKKVVTVNKLCNFTNPHLCITVHDFILARKDDSERGDIRCNKNDLRL